MSARIFASLLVLGSSAFLLTNCSSSDGGSNTPAAGNTGVAGSAAGAHGTAGAPGTAGTPGTAGAAPGTAGAPAGGGGSSAVGGGGSAGAAVAGSGGAAAGSGGASAGASQGGSGGATGGGGSGGTAQGGSGGGAFTLTSSKLAAGMKVPTELACAMNSHPNPPSPPFTWTPGPSATMSYALVMLDTSVMPNGFNHWVVWDIPVGTTMLPGALGGAAMLTMPAGAKQAAGNGMGYLAPCPPNTHTYVFTLYALDVATLPGVTTSTSTANLAAAIQMHDIASATLSVMSDGK